MGTKIYVGNIPFTAAEDDLRNLFSQQGEVESVKIITDAQTGRARGFGFVEMVSDADAKKAISALNGTVFMDRTLTVSEARPQQSRGGRGGFERRGGGGGFNRGRGFERGRR